MRRRSRALLALVATVSLIAAACSGDSTETSSDDAATTTAAPETTAAPTTAAPETTAAPTTEAEPETTTTEAAPEELELIGLGPYPIGVTTIEIANEANDRPLTVDVWMPLADSAEGPAHEYTFLPGTYLRSDDAITADPSALAEGPFPLVVFSHGSSGVRYINAPFTEALASHGYVVISADHTGNTSLDLLAGTATSADVTLLNRLNDVKAMIDAMTDDPVTEPFRSAVDLERIAVAGHSFGGFTAHGVAAGYENELGSFDADDRVDAVIGLAPFIRVVVNEDDIAEAEAENELLIEEGEEPEEIPELGSLFGLSDEDLAGLTVPSLLIGASDDETTPFDRHVEDTIDLFGSERITTVELEAAEHESFAIICVALDFLSELETATPLVTDVLEARTEGGCDEDDMPIDRVDELTETFAISFLDEVLKGGEPLTVDGIVLPDDIDVVVRGT